MYLIKLDPTRSSLSFTLQLFSQNNLLSTCINIQHLVEMVMLQSKYFTKKLEIIGKSTDFVHKTPKYFRLGTKDSNFKYYRTRLIMPGLYCINVLRFTAKYREL